jgi:hypothetical protein
MQRQQQIEEFNAALDKAFSGNVQRKRTSKGSPCSKEFENMLEMFQSEKVDVSYYITMIGVKFEVWPDEPR